jgi:hypothetical protein
MTDQFLESTEPAASPRLDALRGKIRIICHVIRVVTFGYALFVLWGIYDTWSDRPKLTRGYQAFYKLDITGASDTQYALAIGTSLAVWAALVVLCWFVWRLFGAYLRGAIFTRDSAARLQRIGFMGLLVVAFDFAMRPVTVYIMGMHLADRGPAHRAFVRTDDVLYILIALVFVALGFIYKSAAEIADEHAQIV